MKNTVLITTLLLTFASGYLVAVQLTASSPVVLEVAAGNQAAACVTEVVSKTSTNITMPVSEQNDSQPTKRNTQSPALPAHDAQPVNTAGLSLQSYSSLVANRLPEAKELIIQVEDAEFHQLLQNHQQQHSGDLATLEYQQQLADFFAEQSGLSVMTLDCREDLCLLELEIQHLASWPAVFAELSSQSWWQSVSYQNAIDTSPMRRLVLQQSSTTDFNQTAMAPDDGAMQ